MAGLAERKEGTVVDGRRWDQPRPEGSAPEDTSWPFESLRRKAGEEGGRKRRLIQKQGGEEASGGGLNPGSSRP